MTTSIKKDIIDIINNNKGDNKLYQLVFNVLTHCNTVKNYTNNTNGIFFNMNGIEEDTVLVLNDKIKAYLNQTIELKSIEDTRHQLIKEMGSTIDDSSYKTELQTLLTENKKNKNKLSTELETSQELDTSNIESIDAQKEKEKQARLERHTRMKKSILNYKKPIIYTKAQERIKKIMSRSSSGRLTKNKSIEEEDKLYDSDLEDILELSSDEIKPKKKGKKVQEEQEDPEEIYLSDENCSYQGNEEDLEDEVEEVEQELEDLFGDSDNESDHNESDHKRK